MTNPESSTRVVAALRELIVALDRRMPHVERSGEIQIGKDAALLRSTALRRIEELTHAGSDQQYDKELVEAIMTDDGGGNSLISGR